MGAAMPTSHASRIHPTAIISAEADLAADVQVGPYAVIEGKVRVGAGSVLRPYVHLCGPLTMGKENVVYSGAVLGERPQHLKYNNEPTTLEIGDGNVFREHVTVHRGTAQARATRIGNRNYFMAGSHIAHDCQVGSNCLLANGALLGGHCIIQDNVYLSGNCAVHQFVRIGRLALLSGASVTTKDMPPFIMQSAIDCVVGVNVVGMRRAGMSNDEINAVRRAFQILYREKHVLATALSKFQEELAHSPAVAEMTAFIRQSGRGINLVRNHVRHEAA
jgi:UDP-N-acetylglucosamine acyltransferase